MAYQEQIMKIPQELCGWTQGQGDILRRAISKKKQGVMDELLPKFIEDGITRGIDSELMEDLADKIVLFANYGFNKCISGRERIFRRQNGRYHPTIEEMYLIKNNQCYYSSVKKTSLHEKYCRHGYGAALSMGMDGRLKLNRIVDIYYSGTMPVYRLTTSRGCTAECTLNHALPTPKGKKTIKELTVGDEIYINGGYEVQRGNYNWYHSPPPPNTPVKGQKGFQQRTDGNSSQFWAIRDFYKNMLLPCEKCGITNARYQLHHIDENRENNSPENLLWLCDGCHKKIHYKIGRTKSFGKGLAAVLDKIVSIEYVCDERTYDIEVEAPNHNLLLNGGVIVANSHSSAYAWLAYQTAYLKAHYPLEFHCALLNSELGNSEKTAEYVEEVSRLGIKVLPPDVFASKHVWTIEGEALRCGLGCIKGVGSKINFVTEGVTSASDFLKKNWHKNKKALENLIKAGALGGEKKKELIAQVSWLKDYNSRLEEINNKIEDYQEKVDKWTGEKIKHTQTTPTLEIPPGDEEQWEREMLGFTLRDTFANYDISLALTHRDITAGELIKFKRHIDKKGGTMAFLKIKDYEGMIRELVMFSSYFRPLTEGKVYLLKVKETSVIDVTEAKRKPGG
jgi:hypothetical protein